MPALSAQLNDFVLPQSSSTTAGRPNMLVRVVRALQEARLRQAEREVARFIEARGGRLTDTLERQIEHRYI